jgi:hypothetical protein
MSYIFVLPFLPPLFFKHFTMTTKKEINVLKPKAIPGYARAHDQDLAVTGVPADAFNGLKRYPCFHPLKGVTHDAPRWGGQRPRSVLTLGSLPAKVSVVVTERDQRLCH